MEIKHQIREAMRLRSLSVGEVARAVGVSNQSVRHWLSGYSAPTRRHLPALEGVLRVRIDMSEAHSQQLLSREERILHAFPELAGVLSLEHQLRDSLLYVMKVAVRTTPEAAAKIAAAAVNAALAAEASADHVAPGA